jgi:hypothetical protein
MTRTENQFRSALRTVAAEFTEASLPPLELPDDQPAHVSRGRTGGAGMRWLVPLTAAAAVTVIALATTVIGGGGKAPQPNPATATAPPLWHGVPRYFFVVTATSRTEPFSRTKLVVRGSRTGAILATASSPRGCQYGEVSAAADDRTVLLACMVGLYDGGIARLYRARFNPATDRLSTSRLRIPPIHNFQGLALSPDATRIAATWAAGPLGPQGTSAVRAYSTGGTVLRTWRGPGEITAYDSGDLRPGWVMGGLWWSSNSGLAFNYLSNDHTADGVRFLSIGGLSGNLIADSRLAVRADQPDGYRLVGTALSGNTVATVLMRPDKNNAIYEFAEFAAATGRIQRQWGRIVNAGAGVLWTSPDGRSLVAIAPVHIGRMALAMGIVTGNRFEPLEPEPPFSWLSISF